MIASGSCNGRHGSCNLRSRCVRVCCINGREEAGGSRTPLSADRIRLRAPQSPHPIEQRARQRGFPLLGCISLCPQPVTECPFQSGKDMLGVRLRVVTRRPLPRTSTLALDRQHLLIALGRCGFLPWSSPPHPCGVEGCPSSRGMLRNGSVDGLLVVHAIPNEPIDAVIDMGQQRGHL
jgi:hypothetical protein